MSGCPVQDAASIGEGLRQHRSPGDARQVRPVEARPEPVVPGAGHLPARHTRPGVRARR